MVTETHEGGKAYERDAKTELFLRGTTMFYGQDSFYEKSDASDARVRDLARELAVTDWGWFAPFTVWLRAEGNVRTTPMILAVEGVRARLNAKIDATINDVTGHMKDGTPLLTNRQLVDKVLQRPDEPGKLVHYYFQNYGKPLPKPFKRGVADSLTRMVNQRQALRYDKPSEEVRLGDLVELTHPVPKTPVQDVLFGHLITSRHNRENYEPPLVLREIHARWVLDKMSPDERHAFGQKIVSGNADAADRELWSQALAGSWEWGKLWLGEK